MTAPRVVIIGAGVTGLAAASRIQHQRPDCELVVLEQRMRPGGNIVTQRQDGFLIDGGPDSFLRTKPDAVQLCEELQLDDQLMMTQQQARTVYMAQSGDLKPMPGGMALAVPTRMGPMLTTPLLSFEGKLRMLGDLVLPDGYGESDAEDESVQSFVSRRFGPEAAQRLAAPMLGGIYAGDTARLSIHSTFPQLVELERRYGSVIRGMFVQRSGRRSRAGALPRLYDTMALLRWMQRAPQSPPSPFYSLRGGMGQLIDTLTQRLPQGSLQLGSPAARLVSSSRGARWRVELQSGERFSADGVLLATPAHAASRMVPDPLLAAELAAIPYVSTATVFIACRSDALSRPLDGVGFVVPPGEGEVLAATWVSSKWEQRAPQGYALLRAFVGGQRHPHLVSRSTDEELVDFARAELERLMGPIRGVQFTQVFRYENSNPQPVVGHLARLRRIESRLTGLAGVELAGAAYRGVGIPDCIKQARQAADRLVGVVC